MSSFCDIWIGDKQPSRKRKGNSDWENKNNIWWSLPANGKTFYKVYQHKGQQLILIGQLYERLTDEELYKRCTDYFAGKGFKDPAGHYILLLKDHHNTHVFTNRLGTVHAYWSNSIEEQAISTNYLAIAKSKRQKELDWEGVTGFLAMGYFPNDKTYLKGVSIFEPASYYCFDADLNLQKKERYWEWEHNSTITKNELLFEELHDILQSSLSVATEGQKAALPISGGLDSRMLAGELSGYKNIKAFSYGYTASSPELEIAQQIANETGMNLNSYVMPDYLFEQLDDIVDAVELFQYVDGTRQASAKGWLSENADVVVGGHWGDVWMDDMKVASHEELLPAFQKKIIKRGSSWLLENICATHVNKPEDHLVNYFSQYIQHYNDISDADYVMKIYKTDQWSHRWTAASLRMYQSGAFPVLPFYDNRVVDFFSKIDTSVVANREFQIEYIKHYYHALAKIKWQEYDADLYNYKGFNNRSLTYRAASKIKRTITGEKPIQRNWEVFYLHEQGRKKLEEHLLENVLLNEFVPNKKVQELINDLYKNPTGANGYTVSMLLTFSIFLKEVFG